MTNAGHPKQIHTFSNSSFYLRICKNVSVTSTKMPYSEAANPTNKCSALEEKSRKQHGAFFKHPLVLKERFIEIFTATICNSREGNFPRFL